LITLAKPDKSTVCRLTPIENLASLPPYDKEKYKELLLDEAETILGFFGFDRTASVISKREEKMVCRNERTRCIQTKRKQIQHIIVNIPMFIMIMN
jgi:hypothetical protein